MPDASGPASTGDRVLTSFVFLGSGEILARAVAFLGAAYLARVLGPNGFGIVGFATAITVYLTLAVSGGLGPLGAREVARDPAGAPSLAAGVWVVRGALAVAGSLLLVAVAWMLPQPPWVRCVVALSALGLFPLAIDTAWLYQGRERNRRVAVARVLEQAVFVVLVLVAVRHPTDFMAVPTAQFLGQLAAGVLLALPLVGSFRHVALRRAFGLLRSSGLLMASRLLRTVIFTFDVVLLGFLVGDRSVGLYTAAYRIAFLVLAVGAALQTSYLPPMVRSGTAGPQAETLLDRALGLAWFGAAPILVGGSVLASPLLALLFGTPYAEAATALRFLLASIACVWLHGLLRNLFVVADRTGVDLAIMAVAAALNVGLNFWWIPRWGIAGAGAATAASELAVLVLSIGLVARLGARTRLAALWRSTLGAVLMGLALFAMRDRLPVLLAAGAGGALYLLTVRLLGGWPAELSRGSAARS